MDNILKLILIGAGVILTCVVVGVAFFISSESKNTSNSGMNQISSMNTEFQDVNITLYDGLSVSGREVKKEIVKQGDKLTANFNITVKTLANTAGKVYSTTTTASAFPARGNNDYINDNASFLGSITYDSNGVISGITFTQQK